MLEKKTQGPKGSIDALVPPPDLFLKLIIMGYKHTTVQTHDKFRPVVAPLCLS